MAIAFVQNVLSAVQGSAGSLSKSDGWVTLGLNAALAGISFDGVTTR